jgi:hypothetical protein
MSFQRAINATLKSCSAPPISFAGEDEAVVPLPGGHMRGPGGALHPRNVRRDANLMQFWAMFASLRTTPVTLCRIAGGVPDAFTARADANGRSALLVGDA